MTEHYARPSSHGDRGQSQGLTPELLLEIGKTLENKSSAESSPVFKVKNMVEEANTPGKYQTELRKKKPPKDLPLTAKRHTQEKTQSPVYAEPNPSVDSTPLALRINRPGVELVESQGYLEPMHTVDSQTPKGGANTGRAYDNTVQEQLYPSAIYNEDSSNMDYEAVKTQDNKNKGAINSYSTSSSERSKKKGFFNWRAKRKDPKNKSLHIYAEPQFGQNAGNIDEIDSGYTQFVKEGSAIGLYTNDSQEGTKDMDIHYDAEKGHDLESKRLTGCSDHLASCCGHLTGCCGHVTGMLPSLPGRSKPWILGLIAVVVLLVLVMIALAVYYTAFNGEFLFFLYMYVSVLATFTDFHLDRVLVISSFLLSGSM